MDGFVQSNSEKRRLIVWLSIGALAIVYIAASGPMRLVGTKWVILRGRTDGPDRVPDAAKALFQWRQGFETIFGPLELVRDIPFVGEPLDWYWDQFDRSGYSRNRIVNDPRFQRLVNSVN